MNSDPNSDSEQCPESKLGWVHSAHTHSPRCAHSAPRPCAHRRVVARAGPFRGPLLSSIVAVSQTCTDRVVEHGRLMRDVSRVGMRHVAALSAVSCASYAVSQRARCCITTLLRAVSRTKSCPQPRYNIYIATPPLARQHACTRCHTPSHAADRVVRVVGRIVALCWWYRRHARPCCGRVLPSHAPLCALCHDTVYCIVTQNRKWAEPSQPPLHFFFHHHFFFYVLFTKHKNHTTYTTHYHTSIIKMHKKCVS